MENDGRLGKFPTSNTVQAVREELEGSGQIAHFEERQDPRTGNTHAGQGRITRRSALSARGWNRLAKFASRKRGLVAMVACAPRRSRPAPNRSRTNRGRVQIGQSNIGRWAGVRFVHLDWCAWIRKMAKIAKMRIPPPSRNRNRPPRRGSLPATCTPRGNARKAP